MTFDEFWNKRYELPIHIRCTRSVAEIIWNEAKQDCGTSFLKSAYIVAPYETESHKEICWTVYGKEEGIVLFYCQSKERCVEWCLQNYYRVVE